jgi:hypothetical protein
VLALAIIVAVGGYLTIGFAYWAMAKAVPKQSKEAVEATVKHLEAASESAKAKTDEFQRATAAAVASPLGDEQRGAAEQAASAQKAATESLSAAAGMVNELLGGLGNVFKELGALSPPVAALCVAVLMFLTAGGIEVANRLIH